MNIEYIYFLNGALIPITDKEVIKELDGYYWYQYNNCEQSELDEPIFIDKYTQFKGIKEFIYKDYPKGYNGYRTPIKVILY